MHTEEDILFLFESEEYGYRRVLDSVCKVILESYPFSNAK
jgi:hypothetical protein